MHPEIKSIQIRTHYATISLLMRGLHESEKALFAQTDDWDAIEGNYMRHVIEQQETGNGTCLVAYVDGVAAGFIFGYEETADESRIEAYEGRDLYVSDGYVVPAFRRQGIYRQLNEQLEAIYIQQGIRRILRFTLTSNRRMQQFLESNSYQPVRLLYEKWLSEDGTTVVPLGLKQDGGLND